MNGRRGFTFIEILMVVAIVGVISVAAISPLVFSVIRIVETEEEFNEQEALFRVVALVSREISEMVRTAPPPLLRVIKKERLGDEPDYSLIVASISTVRQNLPAGSVVYKILRKDAFSKLPEGLYRWVLPAKLPSEIDAEKLEDKDAQLVMTDIKEFKIETLIASDWLDAYNGAMPAGMKFIISRGEQRIEHIEWFAR